MELQEQLREQLFKLFPDAKLCGNKKEISINCPLCNQEGNIDKGHHMYISLGYDNKPPMYNCFRNMNHRGILTKSVLERFIQSNDGIDTDLMDNLSKYNSKLSTINRYSSNKNKSIQDLKREDEYYIRNNYLDPSLMNMISYKISYFNNRLGVEANPTELLKKKVVFSLEHFLLANNLKPNIDNNIFKVLEGNYIGFITNTNAYIVFRNTYRKDSPRFYNYKIFPEYNGKAGYYIMPTICDTLNHIDIIIAEGIFDIFGLYYHIFNKDENNKIYCAICGNSYVNAIQYFSSELGLIDVTYHIFLDSDIKQNIINQIEKYVKDISAEGYIYINTYINEKDYGIHKDKIKLFTSKI